MQCTDGESNNAHPLNDWKITIATQLVVTWLLNTHAITDVSVKGDITPVHCDHRNQHEISFSRNYLHWWMDKVDDQVHCEERAQSLRCLLCSRYCPLWPVMSFIAEKSSHRHLTINWVASQFLYEREEAIGVVWLFCTSLVTFRCCPHLWLNRMYHTVQWFTSNGQNYSIAYWISLVLLLLLQLQQTGLLIFVFFSFTSYLHQPLVTHVKQLLRERGRERKKETTATQRFMVDIVARFRDWFTGNQRGTSG